MIELILRILLSLVFGAVGGFIFILIAKRHRAP
jgi:hypothetical protein